MHGGTCNVLIGKCVVIHVFASRSSLPPFEILIKVFVFRSSLFAPMNTENPLKSGCLRFTEEIANVNQDQPLDTICKTKETWEEINTDSVVEMHFGHKGRHNEAITFSGRTIKEQHKAIIFKIRWPISSNPLVKSSLSIFVVKRVFSSSPFLADYGVMRQLEDFGTFGYWV